MLAGQKAKKDSRENYCSLFTLSPNSLLFSYYSQSLASWQAKEEGGGLDLVPDTQHPKESYYKYHQIQSAANVSKPTTAVADLARPT